MPGWLRVRRTFLITLVALIACLPGAIAPAPAQEALAEFYPSYDWVLEVDGKLSEEAMFFVERLGRRVLVVDPGLDEIALITQAGKQVTSLDPQTVRIDEDGGRASLPADAEEGRPKSSYTVSKDKVVFYLGNRRLKIIPKKPLEGPATRDEILEHTPLYKKGMHEYTPEKKAIDVLKAQTSPVEIEVFFGTWCPHCKVVVPKFMKCIEVAANPALHVSYVGVPRHFSNFTPARAKGVRSIPTLIFYRDGKEFARIPGEPNNGSIEQAVAKVLQEGK
ncbi:MAG: thioredoxin family protein [Acidobacteriota bacterium]